MAKDKSMPLIVTGAISAGFGMFGSAWLGSASSFVAGVGVVVLIGGLVSHFMD